MYELKITKQGQSIDEWAVKVQKSIQEAEKTVDKIGNRSLKHLRDYIGSHKKRETEVHGEVPGEIRKSNTNNLANSFEKKTIVTKDSVTIGIGVLEDLKKFAPYWAKINNGGRIEVDASFIPGQFSDGSSANSALKGSGKQAFSYGPGSGKGMQNKNLAVIAPMRYVENTIIWIKGELRKAFK